MSYFRKAAAPPNLKEWPVPSPSRPLTLAESRDSFGQFGQPPGFAVWSGKAGRLAWPLSLLIILILSSALWAAIAFAFRYLLM